MSPAAASPTGHSLRRLDAFAHVPFAASPCPAVLLAISQADPQEILKASQHAIQQVRGNVGAVDIADMTLAEMDYAFTNLEFFLSRVGNYGIAAPTLGEWASKPRNATIYYAVEVRQPGDHPAGKPSHAVAILADRLVCARNPLPVEIADADVANWCVGQVFAINRMSDARWSA